MNKDKIKKITGTTSKMIIYALLISGTIMIGGSSPGLPKVIWKLLKYSFRKSKYKKIQKLKEEQWKNSFYYLRGNGLIDVKYSGKQIYISLTEEGKKIAKKCKIDELKIKKPKRWDNKWRILLFDITEKERIKRDALRGKIKEMGLYQLQKSTWIHPYDFSPEVEELKKFFRFKEGELIFITAEKIENEHFLKNHFKLA
jgi:DNA-binding transcriptional regulator PaaX